MKEWLHDAAVEISDFFINVCWFICRIPERITRSISWAIFMWKNEDCEFQFLENMILKKLKSMTKDIAKYSPYKGKSSDVRMMRLAISYLERSRVVDIEDPLIELFKKRYGKLELDSRSREIPSIKHKKNKQGVKFCFKQPDGTILHEGTPEYERIYRIWRRVNQRLNYKSRKYRQRFWDILQQYGQFWYY